MNETKTGKETLPAEALSGANLDSQVDLTNCDREPIHLISHIQPNGALLAMDPRDLTIVQASENTSVFFGMAARDLLGRAADSLFAPKYAEELRISISEGRLGSTGIHLFTAFVAEKGPYHVIGHIHSEMLILEFETSEAENVSSDYSLLEKSFSGFERTATARDFAQVVCEEVRRISGFDRVMVYKFLEDFSGSVIAEDLAPEQHGHQEPFLGLRYPATDIPKQARALFVLNTTRLIPDAAYVPSPMISAAQTTGGIPLDLSCAFLRGVSVMHLEYLLNMGVHASMSLAIVKNGDLWGLISCHHYAPRSVAHDVRTACQFLARAVSQQIIEREASEEAEYSLRIEEMHRSLLEHMAEKSTLMPALADCDPSVKTFFSCGGSAILLDGKCRLFGDTPNEAQIRTLADWLVVEHPQEVYGTSSLPVEYGKAREFKTTGCGVLALQISYDGGYLFWFRPEVVQTVNWAGNPSKPTSGLKGDRLTPRKSFALWQETVDDTALAWKPVEIDAARRLRVVVIEFMARLAEKLAHANESLAKSNEALDAFAYIASHDLKEPLRGIHNMSRFLKEDYGHLLPQDGQENLDTVLKLTKRMETLIDSLLHYSRVGQLELFVEEVELNSALEEVIEALNLRIAETGTQMRIPRQLPRTFCDRVQITEVFQNLITNALKYNDKSDKWVEIGYLDAASEAGTALRTFYVQDNGIGIEAEQQEAVFRIFNRLHGREEYGGGTGAGLTIARKIAERHDGRIWVESVLGAGSTFYFSLPQGQA